MTTDPAARSWPEQFVPWGQPIYGANGKALLIPSYGSDIGLTYLARATDDAADGDGCCRAAQIRKHYIAGKARQVNYRERVRARKKA
jgi:hypothetical protein